MEKLRAYIVKGVTPKGDEFSLPVLAKDDQGAIDTFEKIVYNGRENLPLSEHYIIKDILKRIRK